MSPLDLVLLLGGTLAKGALVLVAAYGAARLLRRRSAASRYAVWSAGFAGLLLLPGLTLVLPSLDAPARLYPGPHTHPLKGVWPGASSALGDAISPSLPRSESRPSGSHGISVRPGPDDMVYPPTLRTRDSGSWRGAARALAPWLMGGWLAGVLAVLGLLVRDVRRIARVTRRAALLRRGPFHDLAVQVADELGLRRPVRIALTRELAVPVTWGLMRPVVLLPAAARRWDTERRRVVLRHELAHVRRGDYAGHLLIELACAIHWLDPFAWRAARRARLEQEQACDDRVLGLGTGSVDYAQHLLDIARTFGSGTVPARGALAMSAAATLPERMRAILDVGLDHRPAGRRTLFAVATAGLLLGVPTAALHPWSDGRRETELKALLHAPDPVLRRDALWALGARNSRGSRSAITDRLRDADAATRGVAAWALGKLDDRSSVPSLIGTLKDADAHVREMAVLALGELRDPRAVASLEPLAHDPEHGVRSVMTVALRQIQGEPAAEALARLVRSDPDPHTRVMAACALSAFESRARLPALEAALSDADAGVRATVGESLEALKSRAAVPALLTALAREPDIDARQAMIRALGASGDPRAVPGLVRALTDTIPQLRAKAANMLGQLGDERAVEPLIAATRDPAHQVRLTAVWALDALQRNQ